MSETMSFADEPVVGAKAAANGAGAADQPDWVTAEDIDALFDKEIDPAAEEKARLGSQPKAGWYSTLPGTVEYKVAVWEARDGMPERPMATVWGRVNIPEDASEARFRMTMSPRFVEDQKKPGVADFYHRSYLEAGTAFAEAHKRTHKTPRELLDWLRDDTFQVRLVPGKDGEPRVFGVRAYRGR